MLYMKNSEMEQTPGSNEAKNINSLGAIVDFSRRPRKVPKSTILMLKLHGAVAICNFG